MFTTSKRILAVLLSVVMALSLIPAMSVTVSAMTIFVKVLNSDVLTLDMDPEDSIYDVKAKVQDKTGVPLDQQCLFYAGRELEDGHTLAEYNVKKDKTITLRIRSHSTDKISVTVTDGIGVNFYLNFDAPTREDVDSATVTYKNFSGETVTKTYQKSALPVVDDRYNKLTVWIAPAQLADEITVNIGDTEYHQSVLAYCEELKRYPDNSAYFPFLNALEQYAQTAKNAFDYAGETIADVSDLTAAEGFDSWEYQLGDSTGKIGSLAFLALTKPEFRFYTPGVSEGTAAACTVTAAFKDGAAGDLSARFAKNANGQVLVEVTGIQAQDLGRTVVVTIDGLGDATKRIEFAGYDFAKLMADKNNNADLGVALYNYGAAAADLVTAGIWV